MGYEVPIGSKEDHESSSFSPVEADDYVVKIGKIVLELQPTWENGSPNYDKKEFGYTVIVSPVALKGGGEMKDTENNKVDPLRGYIFRNINPNSLGFHLDKVTPSFMRAFICYMRNISINDDARAEDFILIAPGGQEILDGEEHKEYKEQYWKEICGEAPNDLIKQGYKHLADIRMYEGKYIGCAIEVEDKKGKLKNKISKWSKLPANFEAPTEEMNTEFMGKVNEFWEKVLNSRQGNSGQSSVSSNKADVIEEAGEVEIADVPI